ncbi:MAG: alpha-hydroxy-acid oxidizing protein [Leptonema sp. (in: bacteria)]
MNKSIIIIGGGILQVPLIQTAKRMNLYTIVFDMDSNASGIEYADEFICMSTKDVEGCVREAVKLSSVRKIDGVITAGTDASKSVSAIANALGLPGIRYSSAEAATNKVLMRKILQKNNIPIPKFIAVWNLREAIEALDSIGLPAVLKPAENMGARGVIKISRREEIYFAYRHSKKYSPTGELILEEFLDGQELSIDALTWNGNYKITGIADRIIVGEPYFIEIGHNMPSRLNLDILEEASQVMINAMKAIGIDHGAGKGDLKVTSKGIYVGEIAARLSGGFMSSHTYPYSTGVDLYKRAIQIALGEEPEPFIQNYNWVVVERGIVSRPGKILSIEGVEKAKKLYGICDIIITKKIGTILNKPTSNIDKIGHIIAKGKTLEEAEAIANQAKEMIQIHIDELEGIDWKQIEENARRKFSKEVCWVCKVCDGTNCASGVPGMGGVGNQFSFIDNYKSLQEYKILPTYIHDEVEPELSIELFGRKLNTPIMIAPMTGASTNLKNAITEEDIITHFMNAASIVNSIAWFGDGASLEKFSIILESISKYDSNFIIIFKPRENTKEILKRIELVKNLKNCIAVGMDIDAIQFKTLILKNQKGRARNIEELKEIRNSTHLPFILKGIMTIEDTEKAIAIGANAIVVSNHGGRILDSIPGTARVLPEIVKNFKNQITILADGGIRSGSDVFKMLCLGAEGVLIGRPFLISAVGGGDLAIRHLFKYYNQELYQIMKLCGIEKIKDMNPKYLFKIKNENL